MMRQEPIIQHKPTCLERSFRLALLVTMVCGLPATLFATMSAAFAEHQSLHSIFCDEVHYVGLPAKLQAISRGEIR